MTGNILTNILKNSTNLILILILSVSARRVCMFTCLCMFLYVRVICVLKLTIFLLLYRLFSKSKVIVFIVYISKGKVSEIGGVNSLVAIRFLPGQCNNSHCSFTSVRETRIWLRVLASAITGKSRALTSCPSRLQSFYSSLSANLSANLNEIKPIFDICEILRWLLEDLVKFRFIKTMERNRTFSIITKRE